MEDMKAGDTIYALDVCGCTPFTYKSEVVRLKDAEKYEIPYYRKEIFLLILCDKYKYTDLIKMSERHIQMSLSPICKEFPSHIDNFHWDKLYKYVSKNISKDFVIMKNYSEELITEIPRDFVSKDPSIIGNLLKLSFKINNLFNPFYVTMSQDALFRLLK